MKLFAAFLLSLTLARAEEMTIPQWRDELAQVYQLNPAHLVYYSLASRNDSTGFVLGYDPAIGFAKGVAMPIFGDKPVPTGFWYPGRDEISDVDSSGAVILRGVRAEVRALSDLAEELRLTAPRAGRPSHQLVPALRYRDGTFVMEKKIVSALHGPWHDEISHGEVIESDGETVTFLCYGHARITISRRTGLATRAVSDAVPGGATLTLHKPWTKDLSPLHETFPLAVTKPRPVVPFSSRSLRERLDLYQLLVDRADEGSLATDAAGEAKLRAVLDHQRGALHLFADGCIPPADTLQKTAEEFSWGSIFTRRLVAKTSSGERVRAILEETMVRACADVIAQRRAVAGKQ